MFDATIGVTALRIAPGARWRVAALALAALASGVGCSGGAKKPEPGGGAVDAYVKALPTWAAFSPTLPDVDPHAAGAPGDPTTEELGGKQFVCVTTPFAIQRTPRELVMYSPDADVLWPGALVQGRSYRDGDGSGTLLPLKIAERTAIKVGIPALKTADNFREVVPSDGLTVGSAVGAILGAATKAELKTPSTSDFKMESFSSEEQFALSMSLSGRYLGFRAKATGEYAQSRAMNTVVVHFMEKMFEVVVDQPQTPSAWFSGAFTQAKLDEQVALGRIGPDNVPVYVSNIVYGRMFSFALSSSATEQEIRATLQAAYSWGAGQASGGLTTDQKKLLTESTIAVASVGGDFEATAAAIRSGDWKAYFASAAPLSSATPLSYTFRSLADNSVALVTETTSYGHTECSAQLAPGFLPVQSVQLDMPIPVTASSGDLNGDGRLDVVWNHLGPTANVVRVGFGKPDGAFDVVTARMAEIAVDPVPTNGWTGFKLLVADMDGDGRDDLVWNRLTATESETHVARSVGDGTFVLQPVHLLPGWMAGYRVSVAHVRAKASPPWPHDLLWNWWDSTRMAVLATAWGGLAPSDLAAQELPQPVMNLSTLPPLSIPVPWSTLAVHGTKVGDLTGDGVDDLAWAVNGMVVAAVNDGAGRFAMGPVQYRFVGGTPCGYECPTFDGTALVDVDGDLRADLVGWDKKYIYQEHYRHAYWQVVLSGGGGSFSQIRDAAEYQSTNEEDRGWPVDPEVRDVSGDGRADLVFFLRGDTGPIVYIRHAEVGPSGFVGFVHAVTRNLAAVDMTMTRNLFGDVNGDGVPDIVLVTESAVSRIAVLVDAAYP